jgi:Tfp pilus assembly protein PilX
MIGFNYQRGSTLIVSLILLTIITVAGLATMGTSQYDEMVTASQRQRAVTLQLAENALRQISENLVTQYNNDGGVSLHETQFSQDCSNGLCLTMRTVPGEEVGGSRHCTPTGVTPWHDGEVFEDSDRHLTVPGFINDQSYDVSYILEWRCMVPKVAENMPPRKDKEHYNKPHYWTPAYRITVLAQGPGNTEVMLQSLLKIVI